MRCFGEWLPENRGFFVNFRQWLKDTGYGDVAIRLYSVAARQILGYLDKPYWMIDPESDLQRAWEHLVQRPITASTLVDYHKGLLKLNDYILLRCHRPPKPPKVNWEHYIGSLPDWLQNDIRDFLHLCQRNWQADRKTERYMDTLGRLSRSLRRRQSHW